MRRNKKSKSFDWEICKEKDLDREIKNYVKTVTNKQTDETQKNKKEIWER